MTIETHPNYRKPLIENGRILLKSTHLDIHSQALELARKRREVAKRKKLKRSYSSIRERSYIVGAIGELALAKLLETRYPLFKVNKYFLDVENEHKYRVDLSIRHFHIEVKTRTMEDWRRYGKRIRDSCYHKLTEFNRKNPKKRVIVAFMATNMLDVAKIVGWNFIEEYKFEYIEKGRFPYIKPPIKKRTDKTFIGLFRNKQQEFCKWNRRNGYFADHRTGIIIKAVIPEIFNDVKVSSNHLKVIQEIKYLFKNFKSR